MPEAAASPTVAFETNHGRIRVALDAERAPLTTQNFLDYVTAGHFDNTIFHRVIPGFMIQGGGFTADMVQKPTRPPIKNEAGNGLTNMRGTLAMARTSDVNSASAQFFINLVDNDFLNHRDNSPAGFGYAVFGHVIESLDVVDAIAKVPTGNRSGHQNVPREAVVVSKATVE